MGEEEKGRGRRADGEGGTLCLSLTNGHKMLKPSQHNMQRLSFHFLNCILFVHVCVCGSMSAEHIEVRRQLEKVDLPLPPSRFQETNSGCLA